MERDKDVKIDYSKLLGKGSVGTVYQGRLKVVQASGSGAAAAGVAAAGASGSGGGPPKGNRPHEWRRVAVKVIKSSAVPLTAAAVGALLTDANALKVGGARFSGVGCWQVGVRVCV